VLLEAHRAKPRLPSDAAAHPDADTAPSPPPVTSFTAVHRFEPASLCCSNPIGRTVSRGGWTGGVTSRPARAATPTPRIERRRQPPRLLLDRCRAENLGGLIREGDRIGRQELQVNK
jgi:hypothetical protein